jgi:hypothetical protein
LTLNLHHTVSLRYLRYINFYRRRRSNSIELR